MKKSIVTRLQWYSTGAMFCVLFVCCMIILGCTGKQTKDIEQVAEEDMICSCPPTIFLQPYGDYSSKEASMLGKVLKRHLNELFCIDFDFEVLPQQPLSDAFLNDAKTRYRADKIIRSLSSKADEHNIYIGLTHRDISCSLRGKADWGVQGLSLRPKKACVVSTFRVKEKGEFWKVVCHEFIHTFYNYGHCPQNDATCLMQDASGHPNLKNKRGLCDFCRELIMNCKYCAK